MKTTSGLWIPLLAVLSATATAQPGNRQSTADTPPKAPTVAVVDRDFGLTLPDPYRWMEGLNNAEFDTWLKAQGEYARARLDALPSLAAWQQRLKQASAATRINRSQKLADGRVFFIRAESANPGTLLVHEADGRERVLLDPASLATGKGPVSITQYSPSPDGSLVAIDLDRGGSEITRVQVLDVATAAWRPDAVEPVWGEFAVDWLPDGSGFTYTQIAPENERADDDPVQNMRVRLHKIGAPTESDALLLKAGSNPSLPLTSREMPEIQFVPGSNWAIAAIGGAQPELRLYVTSRSEALKPDATWYPIADYADNVQNFAVHGDALYLVSMRDHPNGRVLAIDLSRPGASLAGAREILAESGEAIFHGTGTLAAARDALYVDRTISGIDTFLRVGYTSGKATAIKTPFAGGARGFTADPAADGFLVALDGWTMPRTIYRYDAAGTTLRDLNLTATSPGDYSDLTSTETEAVSADGTHIPLSIIHRKDIRLDRSHLTLLFGYGGYGVSVAPTFNYQYLLEWVKAGHVFAVAHVRGGGEKGDAWHRAGQSANKHRGVEDILACAAELARRGYTTPARTALESASAGGLLVGGALTVAPDRFGAVFIQAGMLNPVRLLAGINGANQIAEVGDPRTDDGLKALAAIDPYQHVKDGVAYPAVLLAVGLNDNRVSPWETGKFAARLQATSTSGKPVWLRTDGAAGHSAGGTSLSGQAATWADVYAFLEAQLGRPGK
ncbi:prolyl oligopeptidase family serine peptidase [Sphingomonas sp. H39-1-10]|uniref:prolyl oligopeptidase family serine peptidase n=1 Tax=Sphingomonas pollutisoli TaxID=3030829 RepID=UPI0023B96083|nr:prolyl oligopeptidase family serine peptidase [Sphingomonas pollutisoli]MDF0490312.1 prolyl oligopeptidase family serine peptidase [Sphingomonas pollutisoli]